MFDKDIEIRWSEEKNEILKRDRRVSFNEIEELILNKKFLDVKDHHNDGKYPNQKILIVQINNYGYIVPFVKNGNEIFLKTIIPNRKITKLYNLKG